MSHSHGPQIRKDARPDIGDDHIRISFSRFMCLRSIAYAAHIGDQERIQELLKELASIESRELVGLLEKGTINEANNSPHFTDNSTFAINRRNSLI